MGRQDMPAARHRAPGRARSPLTPLSGAARTTGRRAAALSAAAAIALGGGAGVAVAAGGFSDTAQASTTVAALHPTCSQTLTSSSSDVVLGTGTFLSGWGVWANGPWLCSPSGRWVAGVQTDGNFVAYDMSSTPGKALWNSWTFGTHVGGQAASVRLRPAGDLVALSATGAVLRSSGTAGAPTPVTVALSDTGVLTVTDANGLVRYTTAGAEHIDCTTTPYLACDPLTVKKAS